MLALALELQGVLEMHAGDLKAAEVTLAEAIRRARQLGDVDLFATASIDLVSTLAEGGITKAREALGAIRLVEAFIADVHEPALAIRLAIEKADENLVLAHHEAALPILEQASITDAKRVLGEDHALLLQLRSLHGAALATSASPPRRSRPTTRWSRARPAILGALHPNTLMARVQRCRVIVDGGATSTAPSASPPSCPRRSA